MRRRPLLAGALGAPFVPRRAAAQAGDAGLAEVTVNVFPGGFNWPIFAGTARGFFAREGLRVRMLGTRGSMEQMTDLAAGRFDIAMTAVDNIVAYVEGQGAAPIGPQPDFFAFMGSDSGFLSVCVAPGIERFADLRGRTLSVDARTTGYAFVLLEMLAREGLGEGDLSIVTVGGMTQRWEALQRGEQAGTILSCPYDILAKARGFRQLARATQVIGPYQGNVAAARRGWAAAHPDRVVGYVRAYAAAIDWLYEPGNREEAIAILRRNLPDMGAALAAETHAELLDPQEGFFRGARVSEEGLRKVLDLRARYATRPKELSDPSRYVDPTYWNAAMGGGR
ncbi:ABC transporter substrate-binding protein [Muricoccus nepalensis]|nr:ABC transporter substrate-binding protein [Roseomonas nepalensis]